MLRWLSSNKVLTDSLLSLSLHLASHKILYLIFIIVYCFDANKISLLNILFWHIYLYLKILRRWKQ